MKLDKLEAGKYVVAVSGGVDSMVLLDLLSRQSHDRPDGELQLVVAHFDHGIRPDSAEDRQLVERAAARLGLPFVYREGRLGAVASEATAREARYAFLYRTKEDSGARAIITAHHQDDLLETAVLNLLRGTGRKGLTAISSNGGIIRPLLEVPKKDIRAYAEDRGLAWREDSTNRDMRYLRNYIRLQVLPRLKPAARAEMLSRIERLQNVNAETDALLQNQLKDHATDGRLDRQWFISLPHTVAREVMAAWLRSHGLAAFDRGLIERSVVAAKVAAPGKRIDLYGGASIAVSKHRLALKLGEC